MKLGKYINQGRGRKVYHHPDKEDIVIKVAMPKKNNKKGFKSQNKNEWEVWNLVQNTKYEKYFCPCIEISEDTQYLLQKKAKQSKSSFKYTNILKGLNDADITRSCNCGYYNGEMVLIDYGHPKMLPGIKKLLDKKHT